MSRVISVGDTVRIADNLSEDFGNRGTVVRIDGPQLVAKTGGGDDGVEQAYWFDQADMVSKGVPVGTEIHHIRFVILSIFSDNWSVELRPGERIFSAQFLCNTNKIWIEGPGPA